MCDKWLPVDGLQGVGAGVLHLCPVDDEGGGGAALVVLVQDGPVGAGGHLTVLGVNPLELRRGLCCE